MTNEKINWDDLDTHIESPTSKGGYTDEDLRRYANWRKRREMRDLETIRADFDKQTEEGVEDWTEYQQGHDEYREPLAITFYRWAEIELSTGGDADGFKIKFDSDDGVIGGLYYWADWGVYEEVKLSQEEAEQVAEFYGVAIE